MELAEEFREIVQEDEEDAKGAVVELAHRGVELDLSKERTQEDEEVDEQRL